MKRTLFSGISSRRSCGSSQNQSTSVSSALVVGLLLNGWNGLDVEWFGISELKWTGMGEFNSDDHYIYYCGQEFLRKNGVALIANKSLKSSTWMQSQT